MSEPIVFISTHRIKEGKLEVLRERHREVAASFQAQKPGTVAFLAYINEEGTRATFVHVFPDAEAMEHHMEGVAERAQEAAQFLEAESMEVYGRPSSQVREMMTPPPGSGVSWTLRPQLLGGYIRLHSG